MSVFGGDSWGREAKYRKRRVDDLVIEGLDGDGTCYKKLSNGKFTCLVCPNNPMLDSPLMLSMHCKGSRHRAAKSKLKERELARQDEIKKRIALSDCSVDTANTSTSAKKYKSGGKPLIERTRITASEVVCNKTPNRSTQNDTCSDKLNRDHFKIEPPTSCKNSAASKMGVQQQLDFQERRERELKFTAAGWKRDCHGKWFRDENAEFDSDEEDPNVCLA